MIGQTISHYRILEKLGEGGMGIVYKAHDTELDRLVALKFLPQYLTSDAAEKERFYHEARAASALNHPNITTIFEIKEFDGRVYLSMEFVEGKTLKKLIEQEVPPTKKALDLAIQVCDGLMAAHEKGIVHRDIKSDNIMVSPKGQVKIMDFGLAKVKGATKLTKAGSTLGTAAYMAPEQARGEEVDQRSDIFSLGVVLYELFTGRLPFRGEHHAALVYALMNEEPPPIARFNETVSPELARIVSKAMAKEADERYQHVDDMLADLRRERKGLEYARAGYATASTTVLPPQEPPQKKRLSRILLPVGIIAALGIVVLSYLLLNSRTGGGGQADRKSIAVLPLANLSGEKGDEYFTDGMTEDIITQLSKISDMKVISRASVMQFKGTTKSPQEIGSALGVATVLEGSVRRAGDRVRIDGRLLDARSGESLWAESYDREMKDIFDIQSDVAKKIAAALQAKLSPEERERIDRKPTENLDAYAFYLKGREYYYRYRRQDNEDAINLFRKALSLDANYALAYAGLGDAYGQRAQRFGFQDAWIDSSIAASTKSLSIDPNLAEAYKSLGLAYTVRGSLKKSLEMYNKAIDINPNYFPALGNIGFNYQSLGEYDKAIAWLKKSIAVNPTFGYAYAGMGGEYSFLGEQGKAQEWVKKALDLQPDLSFAHSTLAIVLLRDGQYSRAVAESQKIVTGSPDALEGLMAGGVCRSFAGDLQGAREYFEKALAVDSQWSVIPVWVRPTTRLAHIALKAGDRKQALALLDRSAGIDHTQLDAGSEIFTPAYDLAAVSALRGNSDEAFMWLQKAFDAGWRDYHLFSADPVFESLRNDPRFAKLVSSAKSKVDDMKVQVDALETNGSP